MKFNLSLILLTGTLVCFAGTAYLIWLRFTPITVSKSSISHTTVISLPDLSISLPVTDANVSKDHWPVSSNSLIHIIGTPQPGDPGNSIIYGHNWPNLLGPIKKAQLGQIINIASPSGQIKTFKIYAIQTVTPQQADLLKPSSDIRLTLYTCTGLFDTKRLVISALPI